MIDIFRNRHSNSNNRGSFALYTAQNSLFFALYIYSVILRLNLSVRLCLSFPKGKDGDDPLQTYRRRGPYRGAGYAALLRQDHRGDGRALQRGVRLCGELLPVSDPRSDQLRRRLGAARYERLLHNPQLPYTDRVRERGHGRVDGLGALGRRRPLADARLCDPYDPQPLPAVIRG